jgi:hypothetical protein
MRKLVYSTIGALIGATISLLWIDFNAAIAVFILVIIGSLLVIFHEYQNN